MNRGQGRVFERKGSSYLWIAYYAHGKEQREAARHVRTGEKLEVTEQNRAQAERFLKHRLDKITTEKHGGPAFVGPQQERVTIGELLDSLKQHYELDGKWNVKVASNVKPLREYFGTWRAVDVTSDAIARYIQNLQKQDYKNATINRRTQLLGQAFKLATQDKPPKLSVSVVPRIRRLSETSNARQGFFETADFEAVVSQLPQYLRDFCRFAFLTGWRKGSIESLRWSDVGEDVIYLRAENSKTRKAETMPLFGEIAAVIERRRAAAVLKLKDGGTQFAEYVFHRNGEPVGNIRKAWATGCVAAGQGTMVCPKCGTESAEKTCEACKTETRYTGRIFHDLRRTASRNMIAAGVPQAVAMKITGHRTDSMFRRYAIVSEEQKREALAKTEQYLAKSPARKVVSIGQK